jgi:hypothetical protein
MYAWTAGSRHLTFLKIDMKTRHLVGSVVAVCALTTVGSVHAEVGTFDGADQFKGFTSSKTVAEVRDECNDANARGLSGRSRIDGDEQTIGSFKSTETVANVQDELKAANAQRLSGRNRIDGDEQTVENFKSTETVANVQDELKAANVRTQPN